jgi:hypothetical protein
MLQPVASIRRTPALYVSNPAKLRLLCYVVSLATKVVPWAKCRGYVRRLLKHMRAPLFSLVAGCVPKRCASAKLANSVHM